MSTIKISQFNYLKIMKYAKMCNYEISGFGSISTDKASNGERITTVNEIFPLMKQTCTGVETEQLDSSIVSLAQSKYSRRTRVWWHSHVNMGVFWSKDDEDVIASLGRLVPHLLSIVVNKKGEYRMRFDHFAPYSMFLDNLKLDIEYNFPTAEEKRMAREVKTLVAFKKPPVVKPFTPTPFKGTEDFIHDNGNIIKPDDIITLPSDMNLSDNEKLEMLQMGFEYDDKMQEWVYPLTDKKGN